MKAIRPLTGTGYHADPGEVFSVPDHVAEELAIGGNAIYMFESPISYEIARVPSTQDKPGAKGSARRA